MVPHNILRNVDIRRAMNAQAADATDVNGTTIDMFGYDSIAFVALFGTLTANQVTGIKVQQGAASNLSDAADLAGTASPALADGDGNKMLAVEIFRPTERYVRLVVTRGTANAVIDGAVALLWRGETLPAALHSTVAAAPEVFNSPAEGTA